MATLSEVLGQTYVNNGNQYYAKPKTDGGYDFYVRGQDGNISTANLNDWATGAGLPVYAGPVQPGQNELAFRLGATEDPATTKTTSTDHSAEQEQALYDEQISSLDRLLGLTGSQLTNGLNNLGVQRKRLGDQETEAMRGYDEQGVINTQNKEKGLGTVDKYANDSYTNLMRILQGANAGNSSVGQTLIPTLVAKSAGTRRQGVFDTAGENQRNIDNARIKSKSDFSLAGEDLDTQEKNFRQGIMDKQNELENEKMMLQMKKAAASGATYADTLAAGNASRSNINSRMEALNALFGQFNPTYKPIETNKVALSDYQVDPAKLSMQNNLPGESSYYLTQLRRKQAELG